MVDIDKGIVKISNELEITPDFTFNQFKKTKFYKKQDANRIIYLEQQQVINNRKYLINFFFKNKSIYMLSLICCDIDYSEADEFKRKELHDEVLKEFGVVGDGKYNWGDIVSVYDARSNISSINFIYNIGLRWKSDTTGVRT